MRALQPHWQEAAHSLRSNPLVTDIRDCGLIAGIELEPVKDRPTERAMRVFQRCFEDGLLVRVTGDVVALSPPLTVERRHVDRIFETLDRAVRREAA